MLDSLSALSDPALAVLALLTRTSALLLFFLLSLGFAYLPGPVARQVKHAFWAGTFLLAWVWVASMGEMLGAWPQASYMVERGYRFIFIPNAIVTVALLKLLLYLLIRRTPHEVF